MKKFRIPEFRTIDETTAEAFDSALNEALKELAEEEPEIEFIEKFCARLKWFPKENEKVIVESVRDEFHLEGIYYHCRNCPHMEDPHDRRVKWCRCKMKPTGRTHKNEEACELFYKWISQNQIEPIEDKDLILW